MSLKKLIFLIAIYSYKFICIDTKLFFTLGNNNKEFYRVKSFMSNGKLLSYSANIIIQGYSSITKFIII